MTENPNDISHDGAGLTLATRSSISGPEIFLGCTDKQRESAYIIRDSIPVPNPPSEPKQQDEGQLHSPSIPFELNIVELEDEFL